MGATDHDELRRRLGIAKPGYVDNEVLTIGPLPGRMTIFREGAAKLCGGRTEFGTGARIVQRKAFGEIDRHEAVNPRATLAASAWLTMMPSA